MAGNSDLKFKCAWKVSEELLSSIMRDADKVLRRKGREKKRPRERESERERESD